MKTTHLSRAAVLLGAWALAAFAWSDPVTGWNAAALEAIRGERTHPTVASRKLAILHASMYDAVNGIARTHTPYLVTGVPPTSASKEAAASTAAHLVLSTLFPVSREHFDALHATTLATIPNRPHKLAGMVWGSLVARKVLESRANDGWDAVVPLPDGGEVGDWEPTPPLYADFAFPQWGFLNCFSMTASAQFRPPGPSTLDSDEYAEEYDEVKALGSADGSARTPEQDEIALFWADGAGTETPPGHWNHIAQVVSTARGNNLEKNARLFALLNLALADAAVCAWDAKYQFNFWRPITAINNGDLDGNEFTDADPAWTPFIVTPPFPDYVSGHSVFSAAAATVLARFFATDDVPFTTGSDSLPGVLRSYNSFSEAAAEASLSRIYGGIHFRSACAHGLNAGAEVGEWTVANYLEPARDRGRPRLQSSEPRRHPLSLRLYELLERRHRGE